MSNVVALPGFAVNADQAVYDKDIVKLLKHALEEAKAGRMQFCALAWVSDGKAIKAWAPNDGPPPLLTAAMGAVGYLNAGFTAAVIQGEVDSKITVTEADNDDPGK